MLCEKYSLNLSDLIQQSSIFAVGLGYLPEHLSFKEDSVLQVEKFIQLINMLDSKCFIFKEPI